MSNKIKYNLKNVYAAIQSRSAEGVFSYGTPQAIPGAVNMSLDAEGEASPFYADGVVYFRTATNNGYSGDLEIALIPEWFRAQVLKETKDSNNVFIERSDDIEPVYFALLFEFDGDQRAIRHVLYNCSVSKRPTIASKTKEEAIEPGTETLSLSADPREDGLVKARTSDDTNTAIYTNWYQSVYVPNATPAVAAQLSGLTLGSLELTPAFAAGTTEYTTETENASNVITATGANDAEVTVTVNGAAHTNGTAATWETGANSVVVTASKTGCISTTYTVTVTKSDSNT